MLPLDLAEIIESMLDESRRDNDFLLHPSGHMLGSLRHAQLDVAGAPRNRRSIAGEIRMEIGTMFHERIANRLREEGVPVMSEVVLDPWMPQGWAGRCDLLIWSPEFKAFCLVDLKTIKGDGIRWIARDGAKEEHQWQTSLYWHAAKAMGIPLVKRIAIFYLPVSEARAGSPEAEPLTAEFDPLPWTKVKPVVEGRWKSVRAYLDSLPFEVDSPEADEYRAGRKGPEVWLTDALAPVQPRVVKTKANKTTGFTDVSMAPHWSAAYCEFPLELCGCSLQGENKVGTLGPSGQFIPSARADLDSLREYREATS